MLWGNNFAFFIAKTSQFMEMEARRSMMAARLAANVPTGDLITFDDDEPVRTESQAFTASTVTAYSTELESLMSTPTGMAALTTREYRPVISQLPSLDTRTLLDDDCDDLFDEKFDFEIRSPEELNSAADVPLKTLMDGPMSFKEKIEAARGVWKGHVERSASKDFDNFLAFVAPQSTFTPTTPLSIVHRSPECDALLDLSPTPRIPNTPGHFGCFRRSNSLMRRRPEDLSSTSVALADLARKAQEQERDMFEQARLSREKLRTTPSGGAAGSPISSLPLGASPTTVPPTRLFFGTSPEITSVSETVRYGFTPEPSKIPSPPKSASKTSPKSVVFNPLIMIRDPDLPEKPLVGILKNSGKSTPKSRDSYIPLLIPKEVEPTLEFSPPVVVPPMRPDVVPAEIPATLSKEALENSKTFETPATLPAEARENSQKPETVATAPKEAPEMPRKSESPATEKQKKPARVSLMPMGSVKIPAAPRMPNALPVRPFLRSGTGSLRVSKKPETVKVPGEPLRVSHLNVPGKPVDPRFALRPALAESVARLSTPKHPSPKNSPGDETVQRSFTPSPPKLVSKATQRRLSFVPSPKAMTLPQQSGAAVMSPGRMSMGSVRLSSGTLPLGNGFAGCTPRGSGIVAAGTLPRRSVATARSAALSENMPFRPASVGRASGTKMLDLKATTQISTVAAPKREPDSGSSSVASNSENLLLDL